MATICSNCRFWSDKVAQSYGCGPIEALCLAADSKFNRRFTTGHKHCDQWMANPHGSIDSGSAIDPQYGNPYDPEQGGPPC